MLFPAKAKSHVVWGIFPCEVLESLKVALTFFMCQPWVHITLADLVCISVLLPITLCFQYTFPQAAQEASLCGKGWEAAAGSNPAAGSMWETGADGAAIAHTPREGAWFTENATGKRPVLSHRPGIIYPGLPSTLWCPPPFAMSLKTTVIFFYLSMFDVHE